MFHVRSYFITMKPCRWCPAGQPAVDICHAPMSRYVTLTPRDCRQVEPMVFSGVSQHAEFDFDTFSTRRGPWMVQLETTPMSRYVTLSCHAVTLPGHALNWWCRMTPGFVLCRCNLRLHDAPTGVLLVNNNKKKILRKSNPLLRKLLPM